MPWAFRFEQKGEDYAVVPSHQPEYCPICYSKPEGFDVEFLGDPGSKIDLKGWAETKKKVPIQIVCCNNHIVTSINMAEIWRWMDLCRSREEESSDIGEIRVIYNCMKQGGLAIPCPSTELLEESFIPGKLRESDIWISDKADIEEGVKLKGPLLIGAGVRIEKDAICGPYAIIVNDSVIKKNFDINHCIFSENEMIFNAGDDAMLSRLELVAEMVEPNTKWLPIKEVSPIELHFVNDLQLPYRFNDGRLYAISINKSIPGIKTLQEELAKLLAKAGYLGDVVFHSFLSYSPPDEFVVEVGDKIPVEIIKCIVKVCLQTGMFPIVFSLLSENNRFGYTQRVYFGSLSLGPGILLDKDKAIDILKAGPSICELRRIILYRAANYDPYIANS